MQRAAAAKGDRGGADSRGSRTSRGNRSHLQEEQYAAPTHCTIPKRDTNPKHTPASALQKIQEKFRLDLTDEQAEQFFLGLINDSVTALFPVLMEYIHKVATKLR